MLNAETLFFIDHDQPQIMEPHILLNEPVSPDHNIQRPLPQTPQDLRLFPFCTETAQLFDHDRRSGEPFQKTVIVLLGKDRCRHQHSNLSAGTDRFERGTHGKFRLAEPHIAAKQTVHGAGGFHIFFDLVCGAELIRRLTEGERFFKHALFQTIFRVRRGVDGLADRLHPEHAVCQRLNGPGGGGAGLPPLGGSEFIEVNNGLFRSDVLADTMCLPQGNVHHGAVIKLQRDHLRHCPAGGYHGKPPVDTDPVLDMDRIIALIQFREGAQIFSSGADSLPLFPSLIGGDTAGRGLGGQPEKFPFREKRTLQSGQIDPERKLTDPDGKGFAVLGQPGFCEPRPQMDKITLAFPVDHDLHSVVNPAGNDAGIPLPDQVGGPFCGIVRQRGTDQCIQRETFGLEHVIVLRHLHIIQNAAQVFARLELAEPFLLSFGSIPLQIPFCQRGKEQDRPAGDVVQKIGFRLFGGGGTGTHDDGVGSNFFHGELGGGIEETDGIDLIAEKFQSCGHFFGEGVNIHQPAPPRELAGDGHFQFVIVVQFHQFSGEVGHGESIANLKADRGIAEGLRSGRGRKCGTDGRHRDLRGIGQHAGKCERSGRIVFRCDLIRPDRAFRQQHDLRLPGKRLEPQGQFGGDPFCQSGIGRQDRQGAVRFCGGEQSNEERRRFRKCRTEKILPAGDDVPCRKNRFFSCLSHVVLLTFSVFVL